MAIRWQALFGSALGAADDFSGTVSQTSTGTRFTARLGTVKKSTWVAPSMASTSKTKEPRKGVDSRPVSVLKPKVRGGWEVNLK